MNTALLHRDLETLRPALVRFALLQLSNPGTAEDVVQDTLMAVLEKPDRYAGQSSLRTYVTGILKHKIIDTLRSRRREIPLEPPHGETEADFLDSLFRPDGHVMDMPRAWGDPDATLEQKDFFRVMEICLQRLPARMARVFIMREWLELETDEIRDQLGLSSGNIAVILYRARMQLRTCLDLHWFGSSQ